MNKYKRISIILGVFIVLAITITYTITKEKYQNIETITIGDNSTNNDFKVIAMYQQKDGSECTEDSCYNTISTIPESGYTINETKSYCTVDNRNHSNAKLFTNELGQHVFEKITKNDKCYIWFDKKIEPLTINDIVADATTTKNDFSTTATTDEGTFLADDPMYGENAKATYFRGAVTNNWVKFGGHFWRIIRKNGDGSLRLIYSGTASGNDASKIPNVTIAGNGSVAKGTGTQITLSGTNTFAYVTSNESSNSFPTYVGWTYKTSSPRPTNINNSGANASADPNNASSAPNNSNEYRSTAYEQALSWFNSNISGSDQAKVDVGKFCNDRMTESGGNPATANTTETYYFAARKRLVTNKSPSLACTNAGDVYTTKVGLITADEVAYAGDVYGQANQSYYLYTNQYYWTMSPWCWVYNNASRRAADVFFVSSIGHLDWYYVNSEYGVRPVINLKSDTTFVPNGTGLYNDPYVVL